MRDQRWVNSWLENIEGLNSLRWIPSDEDSIRISKIIDELKCIVYRNRGDKK
jgi:hypothetical protein